jgi:hypothetical protein
VARSSGADDRRLTSSVEIVRVSGPETKHLAEIQLEAIKEILAWALGQRNSQHDGSQHDTDQHAVSGRDTSQHEHDWTHEDRAA